ncbi:MAG: REP-associated tyrosine transposase [Gaiellales bacterium]|jgi:REP element-mobilizing transposase RayT|nr:REP-associated tyrosine transposase [Gaiellales bacterium]
MHAVGTDRLFTLEPEAVGFLRILGEVVSHRGLELFAYCLMSTHVHILIRDPQASLPHAMRDLTGRYARWFNKRQRRRGPLFEGRYHRTPVDDNGHFLAAVRYIVLNPVEAGLCRSAADWRWSSHRAQAGVIKAPAFLCTATVLEMLRSAEAYVRFVEGEIISATPAAAPPRPARGNPAGGR